jgi:putative endopeptidase
MRLASPGIRLALALLAAMSCRGSRIEVERLAPAADRPAIGAWGFDLGGMDRSFDPGDDFFRFANGAWLQRTPIPPDHAIWGAFAELRVKTDADLRAALESPEAERKLVDYYRSYVDVEAIERRGLEPVQANLDRIAGALTHDDVARLMTSSSLLADGPIGLGVGLDPKHPDVYVLGVGQAGLGLPDRDYYLSADSQLAAARAQYREYVANLLGLANVANAQSAADAIVALEKRIAELHWPREKSRDRDLTYNPRSRAELVAMAPEFPWRAALEAFGAPAQDSFVVAQPDAIQGMARLFRETPVSTWRSYLAFHHLDAMSDVLPESFDRASFDFHGRVLGGATQRRERWRRALAALSGSPQRAPLAEALGRLYVERRFSPESKQAMLELVENLRAAYRVRIERLPWMTDEAKRAALRKLETLRVKIGYPDAWQDLSQVEVRAGDACGNRQRELVLARARDLERLARPADRDEWGIAPHVVNAYYRPGWNEIVFPAAILQPPFFDPHADPAVNYGAVGMVIGHELGHAFDDQGAKSDEHGVLRTWWTETDAQAFRARTARLAEQYSQLEVLPGLRVHGERTLGENIGDLAGVCVALEAYRISRGGAPAPVIDGFTGPQRFFLGFAQIWRTLAREEALRTQVVADPHAPAAQRVNGSVRNIDDWYDAFGVAPGARLYLAPHERVRIW